MTRLHDWFLATWYGGTARGRWLLPAAWLFAGVTSLRRQMYAWGWLARYRSRRPVVVVGNLTVGGTGKTPLVIWLARGLASRGVRVGIALRGYGREGGQARRVSPSDSAATVGDEALMLERKLGVPVAVASRRPDAVRLLEDDCDLVLCDDGLQHLCARKGLRGRSGGRTPRSRQRDVAARGAAARTCRTTRGCGRGRDQRRWIRLAVRDPHAARTGFGDRAARWVPTPLVGFHGRRGPGRGRDRKSGTILFAPAGARPAHPAPGSCRITGDSRKPRSG